MIYLGDNDSKITVISMMLFSKIKKFLASQYAVNGCKTSKQQFR